MTMTRPHEALHLRRPIGRRLPTGLAAWNIGILLCTAVLGLIYVIRVNATSDMSFQVSNAQKQVDDLRTQTMGMQDKLASLSSLQELAIKASGNGYVPVDSEQFISLGANNVAMK